MLLSTCMLERIPPPPSFETEVEDFKDNPTLYRLLKQLPKELQRAHIARIEHLTDEQSEEYLYALHERREAALRESVVSDEELQPYFEDHKVEIWKALETRVFNGIENHLGAGTTARVKRLDLTEFGDDAPTKELAVKYLVTPTEKTLSASGEHDMIVEVEQLQAIEKAEREALGDRAHIRVPHPYFHYQKGKLQCYGMELIDGINLDQGLSGAYDPALKTQFSAYFASINRDALMREVDLFFDTMHSICIHGDIKPRNLMISQEGQFFVIDFGQSLLQTKVDEKSAPAFEELKAEEKRNAKDVIRFFLDTLV